MSHTYVAVYETSNTMYKQLTHVIDARSDEEARTKAESRALSIKTTLSDIRDTETTVTLRSLIDTAKCNKCGVPNSCERCSVL